LLHLHCLRPGLKHGVKNMPVPFLDFSYLADL